VLTIRTILHPTDFSECADTAFQFACSLARDYGARLCLLHVGKRPVVTPVEGAAAPGEPEQYREELTTRLHELRAENLKIPVEHYLIFGGNPGTTIIEVAQRTGADLIVMGTHGRKGLGRLLMGSVAERVVRDAPCPVVVVKTPSPSPAPQEETLETTGSSAEVTGG